MKILIISHNPVSAQSSMGKTFLSLFSEFDSSELCQLYIYPTVPNESRCGSYYRVTDKEALKSVITRKRIGGEIAPERITEEQGIYENAGDESLYRSRKNKSALRRLMRDAVWMLAPWYNRELRMWLDREKPDCIFVAPGVAKFIYDFALKISRERDIPIVTYVCDEYYFVKRPDTALDRLRLGLLKAKIDKLMKKTSHLVVISRELEENYSEKFGVETTVLMTGAAFDAPKNIEVRENPKEISYFGNIRSNRFISLGQIGEVLDEINAESGENYRLKIYTSEKNQEILDSLKQYASVELCGFVTGAAFEKTLHEAQLLLHTEAFDEESIDRVRNSVSTKIADSLASGILLLAYGPAEVSSMKHLMRLNCALTATNHEELKNMLLTAFSDESVRRQTVQNALAAAREYHDSAVNSRRLKEILRRVSANSNDK